MDAIHRLNVRSLVTLNVPTKVQFEAEVSKTLNQTKEDIIINFELLLNISHLWTLVDEPFKFSYQSNMEFRMNLEFAITGNDGNTGHMPQVSSCHLKGMIILC